MIQFPIDGDRHYLKYRKDVIDNPKYQKNTKQIQAKLLKYPQHGKSTARLPLILMAGTGIMMVS
ncbi:MAG: hypothetical protein Ct9H300mP4_10730 [Gammaproteobacteria bacterium]|nr:MAG: hypothetical protein Ct9H300mP4_10730 [Gammaproteobacteria bacterium]